MSDEFDVKSYGDAFIQGKLGALEIDELKRHLDEVSWSMLVRRRRARAILAHHNNNLNDVCALLGMLLEELQEHRLLK